MITLERLPRAIGLLWRYGIVRFGVAGVVNTLFGASAYVALVWLGMNLFAAQLVATILGVGFNFMMFTLHVFPGSKPAPVKFILAYTLNYGLSLALLAAYHLVIRSPYIAGVFTMATAAVVNYLILKRFVFLKKPAEGADPRA